MDWTTHLIEYCERGSTAFWAEPLNAVSNISYFLAAIATWRLLRRERGVPVSVGFLPVVMTVVGVGSSAFHTIATTWSKGLDVAPIALFVLWYLASFLRWFYGQSWGRSLLGVAVFIAATVAVITTLGDVIPNRSAPYVPVLLLLLVVALALALSQRPQLARHWPAFGAAGATFAVALIARSTDESVCSSVPIGTHFLWHLGTGLLLFLVGRPLIRRWHAATAETTSVVETAAAGGRLGSEAR